MMEGTGRIRKAEEKDIDAILRILSQVLEVHAALRPDYFISGTTKYTADELREIISDSEKPVFVYVNQDDEVLGYLFAVLEHYRSHVNIIPHDTLYIDDLCVEERARGKGIARALCTHAEQYAREQGCYNVTLNVWTGNNARTFYDKAGYGVMKTMMEKIL
ncbi:MAG: GNAT family N-acetyltransferase [Solobacterium sp.]|nr:GNAT family N-acetyltransferase [Solobacterium sp.]